MGRFAEELEKVKSEISIMKERLREKNEIPRTRKANVVTVKTLSEIFPEMKALEAVWLLGETDYSFKFSIDGDVWDSKFAGKTAEISEECDTAYLLKFEGCTSSLKKEWTFNKREKTFKVKVDISFETNKLEKLYARAKEIKEEVEKEKIEEQKEAEEQEKNNKAWFRKVDVMQRWIMENIEDPDEQTDCWEQFIKEERFLNTLYYTPEYEIIYPMSEKKNGKNNY